MCHEEFWLSTEKLPINPYILVLQELRPQETYQTHSMAFICRCAVSKYNIDLSDNIQLHRVYFVWIEYFYDFIHMDQTIFEFKAIIVLNTV